MRAVGWWSQIQDDFWSFYRTVYFPGIAVAVVGLFVWLLAYPMRRHLGKFMALLQVVSTIGVMWAISGLFWRVFTWGIDLWPYWGPVDASGAPCDPETATVTCFKPGANTWISHVPSAAVILVAVFGIAMCPFAFLTGPALRQDVTAKKPQPPPALRSHPRG